MIQWKNYLCHNVFNKEILILLLLIQVRTDENKFLQIKIGVYKWE